MLVNSARSKPVCHVRKYSLSVHKFNVLRPCKYSDKDDITR